MDRTRPSRTNPALLTLCEAATLLGSAITPRQLRRQIAQGRLPAAKLGRAYLVAMVDVRALFLPTLQLPRAERERQSPSSRARAQLAAAGIVVEGRGERS